MEICSKPYNISKKQLIKKGCFFNAKKVEWERYTPKIFAEGGARECKGGENVNFVDPIRDEQTIDDIAAYLKKQSERNYIMFMVGVHSGLRISDILRIKIRDVKNKSSLNIIEKKTGKQKNIPIMPRLRKILNEYCKDKDPDDYLIKSRQNYNSPISRDMAYKILSKAGEEHGVFNIGTHSLRKTFGYHFYNQYGDIVMLQQIFNHSHPRITLRYIGMTDESTERAINNFKYKMSYS